MNRMAILASIWLVGSTLTAAAAAGSAPVSTFLIAVPWNWTGLYIGAHDGGAVEASKISDPFGSAPFGDTVRSPGLIGGGQIGANYQTGNLVFGVEGDASWAVSRGDNTCFGVRPGELYAANCSVTPDLSGTVTGRLGYTFGRSLIYAKGGSAWERNSVNVVVNKSTTGLLLSRASNYDNFGWTLGTGVEFAITPAWSLNLEYDYLSFGAHKVGTPYIVGNPLPGHPVGPTVKISNDVQQFEMGLNYKLGADPGFGASLRPALSVPDTMSAEPPLAISGWETELGVRYMYSSGREQWDFRSPAHPASLVSRLTWSNMMSNSSELYGRVDIPSNFFVAGFVGAGLTFKGDQNDEDFGYQPNKDSPALIPYQNTYSSNTGSIRYGVVDLGYDMVRRPDLKFGPFVGYTAFDEDIFKHGCAQIVHPSSDCNPPVSTSQLAGLDDILWQGVRMGVSGQVALTDRIRFGADVAYLTYVGLNWLDDHIARDAQYQMLGHGAGVQTEAKVTYNITDRLDLGVGARYWAMWTNAGTVQVLPGGILPNRNSMELTGAFVQLGYRFGPDGGASKGPAGEGASSVQPSIGAPAVGWSGFYGGVEGGGAWGSSEQIGDLPSPIVDGNPAARPTFPATPRFEASGALIGGTAGFNAQFGGIFVYGVEGDASWAGVKGSARQIAPFPVDETAATKEHFLGTGRARLGVAPANGWLVYGTGGLALADIEATIVPSAFAPESHLRAGWTAGAGFEAAIAPHWSTKLEYLHVGLEDHAYFVPTPNNTALTNRAGGVPLSNDIIRVGLNYGFN